MNLWSDCGQHSFQLWLTDYVMGDTSCRLTVLDVAHALQDGYACITGGRSSSGASILTFPDSASLREISDDEYKNLVTYLTSIPTHQRLQDADLGFVIVLDRRLNGWSSVKTVLLRISGFFPGLIQEVLVLRPTGFFQRHVTDMGYKMVKDDFKFSVHLLNSVEELYTHLDKDQLSKDVGGTLDYDHGEWVQQRCAVEKFSMNTHEISQALRELCDKIQETEFPNDVEQTESLIEEHRREKSQVLEDLTNTVKHGEVLLRCFKSETGNVDGIVRSSSELPVCKQLHITAVERLLVQLEETKVRFNDFWNDHETKLNQCLQLRAFEEDFRQLQYTVQQHITTLKSMSDPADSLEKMDMLNDELLKFEEETKHDISHLQKLQRQGSDLMSAGHYAIDCILPKCEELQRIYDQFWELLTGRSTQIARYKELQQRMDKANTWCTKGVDLLASQQIDRCNTPDGAEKALCDIDNFLGEVGSLDLDDPREFRLLFDDVINHDTSANVQSMLKRIQDVQDMCHKRRGSLKKLAAKPNRPVQQVSPEPVQKEPGSPVVGDNRRKKFSSNKPSKTSIEVIRTDGTILSDNEEVNSNTVEPPCTTSSTGSTRVETISSLQDVDTQQAKRGHVMKELIDTERVYVEEMKNILEGYAAQMDNPDMQDLIPPQLVGQKEALFGNMQQIFDFHNEVFLKDLENCRNTPVHVGKCFVDRKENFQMYSMYCQNKPRSEALRKEIGDNNPFFKECWRRLGHKLPLSAYLLKPVQRVTKYQLLLKEMVKYTGEAPGSQELQQAVATMLEVLKYVNDAMNQLAIIGYKGDLRQLGKLLMQATFMVRTEHKKDKLKDIRFKPMQRHVFLYEKTVLFCKMKEDPQNLKKVFYYFKNALEIAEIGITENVRGDHKKFELWKEKGRAEVFIIQAPSVEVKNIWVSAIKKLLLMQFDKIKESSRHISDVSAIPINSRLPGSISGEYHNGKFHLDSENVFEEDWTTHDIMSDDELIDDSCDTASSGSQGSVSMQFMALAEYTALSETELTMREGDVVDVIKCGSEGWWFVQNISTAESGWVPKSFLEACKHRSQSDMSVCSAGSGATDLKACRSTSRTSVGSTSSCPNESAV